MSEKLKDQGRTIRQIVKERDAIDIRIHRAIRERIPEGSIVHVRHGDNMWPVIVIKHDSSDWGRYHSVTVEGLRSGTVYTVDATRLAEFNER